MSTTAPVLPNPVLLRRLFERYYHQDNRPPEGRFVSSHWRQEAENLRVRDDGEGGIVPIAGPYWGCNWPDARGRLSDQLCMLAHWLPLSHQRGIFRLYRLATRVCRNMGLDPTFTVFRQVCTIELLQRHLSPGPVPGQLNALVIGDGIGVLSALLKAAFPLAHIVLVDIGKSLLFQAYFLQQGYPACRHELAEDVADPGSADFVYCPTEKLEEMGKFEFDISMTSNAMQEMNPATIERYFTFMRQHLKPNNLFYCCSRERKEMVGGEVSEFHSYPWHMNDGYLVDGPCPWQRFFFSRHRAVRGPRMLGLRIPLVNYYDGRIVHRLAVLETS